MGPGVSGDGEGAPRLSIIVPTLNRDEVLCQTLEGLLRQECPSYEVLVVDQSDGHTAATLAFLEAHRGRIRRVVSTERGLPRARNLGARHARGAVLLYCDDDVVPSSGLARAHLEAYHDPRVGMVAGRILLPGQPVDPSPNDARVLPNGRYVNNFSSTVPGYVEAAHGCNFSCRREAFLAVGGFDERFTGNAYWEDTDFSFRVRRAGYLIRYEPRALVLHLLFPTGGCRTRTKTEWYRYSMRNHTLFFLQNMPKRYLPLFLLTQLSMGVRCVRASRGAPSSVVTPPLAVLEGTLAYLRGRRARPATEAPEAWGEGVEVERPTAG